VRRVQLRQLARRFQRPSATSRRRSLGNSAISLSLRRGAALLVDDWDRRGQVVAKHGVHLVLDLVEARNRSPRQDLGERCGAPGGARPRRRGRSPSAAAPCRWRDRGSSRCSRRRSRSRGRRWRTELEAGARVEIRERAVVHEQERVAKEVDARLQAVGCRDGVVIGGWLAAPFSSTLPSTLVRFIRLVLVLPDCGRDSPGKGRTAKQPPRRRGRGPEGIERGTFPDRARAMQTRPAGGEHASHRDRKGWSSAPTHYGRRHSLTSRFDSPCTRVSAIARFSPAMAAAAPLASARRAHRACPRRSPRDPARRRNPR